MVDRVWNEGREKSCMDLFRASLNTLFEELSARALAEFEVETRFRARAAHGDPQAGLALLDGLERNFSGEAVTK